MVLKSTREVWIAKVSELLEAAGYVVGDEKTVGYSGRECVVYGDKEGFGVVVSVHRDLQRGVWTELGAFCSGVAVELTVRPELPGEWIDKLLGITLDVRVGDRDFDAAFVVEAVSERVARKVLGSVIRAGLMKLPEEHGGPVLRLFDGKIIVGYGAEPGESFGAALEVIERVHEVYATLHEAPGEVENVGAFRTAGQGEAGVDPVSVAMGREKLRQARRRARAVAFGAIAVGAGIILSALLGRVASDNENRPWRNVAEIGD